MYFELVPRSEGQARFGNSPAVDIHFCSYDKDEKGLQMEGAPMRDCFELEQRIEAMIQELLDIKKQASQYLP